MTGSTALEVGRVIERRQIQMFAGDLYTPYRIEAVRSDKFYGVPLNGGEPAWFLKEMRGKTWR